MGGSLKIDSIQNVILLRRDLPIAWNSYNFGANPDVRNLLILFLSVCRFSNQRFLQRNYIIVPFIDGYADIAGKTLGLDHIQNPNLRLLDDLLRDHFLQGIFKHMKGAGEPSWGHESTFGPGAFNLSQMDIRGTAEDRGRLEPALVDHLHSTMIEQQLS